MIHGENLIAAQLNPDLTPCHILHIDIRSNIAFHVDIRSSKVVAGHVDIQSSIVIALNVDIRSTSKVFVDIQYFGVVPISP